MVEGGNQPRDAGRHPMENRWGILTASNMGAGEKCLERWYANVNDASTSGHNSTIQTRSSNNHSRCRHSVVNLNK